MDTELKDLIGKKVLKIYLNKTYLKFETDQGNLVYIVEGDCCSSSYFFDFYGVKNLLENEKVIAAKEVELHPSDLLAHNNAYEIISVYGYQITTESKEYGEVTSVFSFRNSSNGYYGGYISKVDDQEVVPEIKADIYEVK